MTTTIRLTGAGKRFNREWIFRNIDYSFSSGKAYAITGANGSGKSTLLQAIAGSLQLSEGKCNWTVAGSMPEEDQVYPYLSIAAPYLELVEEMTAKEFLRFHSAFKPFLPGQEITAILTQIGLQQAADKQIRYFSSGMKQRLKLAQAFFSDTQVLLLDEPTTNLDVEGCELYHRMVTDFSGNRLVIVSSNDPQEYHFCQETISIAHYKK